MRNFRREWVVVTMPDGPAEVELVAHDHECCVPGCHALVVCYDEAGECEGARFRCEAHAEDSDG